MKTQNRFVRLLLFSVGLISLTLGFAGAFLPLIPTTPFILLAAWCFYKSSPTAHEWLRNHRWLGPPLKQWEEKRAISKKSKVLAIVTIGISLGLIWIQTIPITIKLVLSVILVGVSIFIATRSSATGAT